MKIPYCSIEKGDKKVTTNQYKKHRLQMTDRELAYLSNQLLNVKKLRFGEHALTKDIGFDIVSIKKFWFNTKDFTPYIIEYNKTLCKNKWSDRVLLKLPMKYDVYVKGSTTKKCNLCLVVEFKRGFVVTVYYNTVEDKHSTLDVRRYCKNLKIF